MLEQSTQFSSTPSPTILRRSAASGFEGQFDLIITDPPYHDAIPYSDLMDFSSTCGYVGPGTDIRPRSSQVLRILLGRKWNQATSDGELIDDERSRHEGDAKKSKRAYEEGMYQVFVNGQRCLAPDGRFLIVFEKKRPDAWETLVAAIIRAGFVVDGNWPIQTEMGNRNRALTSAALSSSVWLVCKKRPDSARPGWDNRVLDEMRHNIHTRLRDYWDAGIRGPDFVWAATGPAMEAYSKHPVVKKANEPGKLMEVAEFLRAVRCLVVDFVVGQQVGRRRRRRDHRERSGRRHDLLYPPSSRLRTG